MLGKIEGRGRRGEQRMRWLDGITDSMDVSLSECLWRKAGQPWKQGDTAESCIGGGAFVLFSSFHSSAELVFSLEPRRGEGAEGTECLPSGPTLDSEPARVAPCLLRRLLSGRVCILLCGGVSSTLHRGKAPHTGPTRPVWFHFGVSS